MGVALWVLQVLAALVYGASGVMKACLFDRVSGDVPSFGALPKRVWNALGVLELVCVVGLLLPAVVDAPAVAGVAAAVLATESLVFVGVHVKYREAGSIAMSGTLGLLMAVVAYGRLAP